MTLVPGQGGSETCTDQISQHDLRVIIQSNHAIPSKSYGAIDDLSHYSEINPASSALCKIKMALYCISSTFLLRWLGGMQTCMAEIYVTAVGCTCG